MVNLGLDSANNATAKTDQTTCQRPTSKLFRFPPPPRKNGNSGLLVFDKLIKNWIGTDADSQLDDCGDLVGTESNHCASELIAST